jgi:hypothetical protein
MICGTCVDAIFFGGLSDVLFRQISDISCALLCIVGRNRNERRLLGYIYQSLTVDVTVPNLEAAGSNPAGRAISSMTDDFRYPEISKVPLDCPSVLEKP